MDNKIPRDDKIMKIGNSVITTNIKNRTSLVKNTLESLNKFVNYFTNKTISVDVFTGDIVDNTWFNQYNEMGWNVLYKDVDLKRSMILNQKNAISNTDSEIILYSEDDIIINNLPKLSTIDKLFNDKIVNNKNVGFISFNNHVWINFNENPKHIIDYINNINNYIIIDDDVFLIKNDIIRDKYYLNFPVSIFKKDLFLDVQEYSLKNLTGKGVEEGMTYSWFEMKKDDEYEVLIYLKTEILEVIKSGKKISVIEFYDYANIKFWNNDKNLRHESINNRTNTIF